jgi:hypothetical protein
MKRPPKGFKLNSKITEMLHSNISNNFKSFGSENKTKALIQACSLLAATK